MKYKKAKKVEITKTLQKCINFDAGIWEDIKYPSDSLELGDFNHIIRSENSRVDVYYQHKDGTMYRIVFEMFI